MGSNVFFATMAKADLLLWQISGRVLDLVRGKSHEVCTSPQRDSRTGRGNASGYCPRDFVNIRCLKKQSIYQSIFQSGAQTRSICRVGSRRGSSRLPTFFGREFPSRFPTFLGGNSRRELNGTFPDFIPIFDPILPDFPFEIAPNFARFPKIFRFFLNFPKFS